MIFPNACATIFPNRCSDVCSLDWYLIAHLANGCNNKLSPNRCKTKPFPHPHSHATFFPNGCSDVFSPDWYLVLLLPDGRDHDLSPNRCETKPFPYSHSCCPWTSTVLPPFGMRDAITSLGRRSAMVSSDDVVYC